MRRLSEYRKAEENQNDISKDYAAIKTKYRKVLQENKNHKEQLVKLTENKRVRRR